MAEGVQQHGIAVVEPMRLRQILRRVDGMALQIIGRGAEAGLPHGERARDGVRVVGAGNGAHGDVGVVVVQIGEAVAFQQHQADFGVAAVQRLHGVFQRGGAAVAGGQADAHFAGGFGLQVAHGAFAGFLPVC